MGEHSSVRRPSASDIATVCAQVDNSEPPNYRRHVAAETKIQQELREQQDREAELKRARNMARSQPNLLHLAPLSSTSSYAEDPDEEIVSSGRSSRATTASNDTQG